MRRYLWWLWCCLPASCVLVIVSSFAVAVILYISPAPPRSIGPASPQQAGCPRRQKTTCGPSFKMLEAVQAELNCLG
jgi:hypothetical protein